MEIFTKRFLLRNFVQEDESAFLAYHVDPRYAEFCSLEEVTLNFTHDLFQRFMQWATEVPQHNYQVAIVNRCNRELIGCGGLRQDGYAAGQAELENHGSTYFPCKSIANCLLEIETRVFISRRFIRVYLKQTVETKEPCDTQMANPLSIAWMVFLRIRFIAYANNGQS